MKPKVKEAVDEIAGGLPANNVIVKEDDDGGAYVLVEGVDLGPSFTPRSSWIAFQITWTCPDADVYPHFIDSAVVYRGNGETPNVHISGNLPIAMSRDAVAPGFDRPAIQISRRSNRRDPGTDTPLQKLLRVLEFVRTR